MRNISKILLISSTALFATPVFAQTATVKLPLCLQVRDSTKFFVPCTGVVPVDTATGNALSWADLLNSNVAAAGATSSTATPVQNTDGSKVATDASVLAVKTALGTPLQAGGTVNIGTMPSVSVSLPAGGATDASLQQIKTALGSPLQTTGGSVSVTNFPSTQSVTGAVSITGTPTVNIGTMPALSVSNTLAAGAATDASVVAVKTTLGTPFQAGGNIGNTYFGARLQDNTGAAFGTSANPVYVSGISGGSSTPTGTAGSANAAVLSVQGIAGGVAQAISGTVSVSSLPTVTVGSTVLATGAATDASVLAVKTALGTPLQAGGSVSISNTPTVNLGTLNGAATAAKQDALVTALGSPLQAGGTVAISNTYLGARLQDTTGAAFGTSANPLYVTGGAGGGSTPTGTAGSPTAAVVSVQGVTNGTVLPVNGTVTANLGTLNGVALDTSVQGVTAALNNTPGVKQADSYATGSIASATVNAAYTINIVNGSGTGGVVLTGLTASAATLTPEGSFDGVNFVPVSVVQAGSKVMVSAITADGQYRFNAAGRRSFRFRVSSVGTGAVTAASTMSVAAFDAPSATLDSNGYATTNLSAADRAYLASIVNGTKPISSFAAMTVATSYAAGIGVGAACSASGNIVLQAADGSQITVPVNVGYNQFAFAVTQVVSQTATCTFTKLS